MSTYADRPSAETDDEFVPCGPDCACAADQAAELALQELVDALKSCDCDDCKEIYEYLNLAFLVGQKVGYQSAVGEVEEIVDAATSEAVKSTLDLVTLDPFPVPDPEFISDEDADKLLKALEELGEDDYDFDFKVIDLPEGNGRCGDPTCPCNAIDVSGDEETGEQSPFVLIADLAAALDNGLSLTQDLIEALNVRFNQDDANMSVLDNAVVALQDAAKADALYLESLDARLVQVEAALGLKAPATRLT